MDQTGFMYYGYELHNFASGDQGERKSGFSEYSQEGITALPRTGPA